MATGCWARPCLLQTNSECSHRNAHSFIRIYVQQMSFCARPALGAGDTVGGEQDVLWTQSSYSGAGARREPERPGGGNCRVGQGARMAARMKVECPCCSPRKCGG